MKSIKRLLPFLKPYRKHCIAGPVFKLIEAILELYLPLIMARVIDQGVATGDSGYILRMGGIMLGVVTVGLLCALVCQYVASIASQGFGTEVRNALFSHIQSLSHREMDRLGTPSLINRVTNDVNQLQYAVAMLIRLVVRAPFLCIGGIVMAMSIDLPLSLVIIIAVPLFVVVITLVMRKTIPLQQKVQTRLDRLILVLRENLSGIRVIRAFSRTRREEERFGDAVDEHTRAAIRVGKLSALLSPATQLIMNLAILAIVWFGGVRVEAGGMTTGEIIAFINYVNQILLALMVVANLVITFTKAYASAGRVAEVLDTESSLVQRSGTVAATEPSVPEIEFRQVSFSYGGGEQLSGISFRIYPGQMVGIIGGTGSGKSTVLHLIEHFYDATQGEVLVEGRDVREWDPKELRRRIGLVPQKTELFTGTIADNLRWGNPQASDEQLLRAAHLAQAAEFIERLPDGLASPVERGGANLSGGQRQRLAIARALVRDPQILMLDDASSALDYATDAALRRALRDECQHMTLVVVSQRVSAVESADLILVLDEGTLAGVGTHDELLKTCETYREINRVQTPQSQGKEVQA